MIPVDAGFVYPKTGLDADLRFGVKKAFVSSGSARFAQGSSRIDFTSPNAFTNFSWTCWFQMGQGASSLEYMGWAPNVSWGIDTSGDLKFYDKTTSTSYQSTNVAVDVSDDRTWHHLAYTLSSSGALKGYLDGQEFAMGQPGGGITIGTSTGATAAGIGSFQAGGGGSIDFDGSMCHVGWFASVLTQENIRDLMRCTTYAEVQAVATPAYYFLLESDNADSASAVSSISSTSINHVSNKARLPLGFDLTKNELNAQCVSGRAWVGDGTGDFLTTELGAGLGDTFSISIWGKRDAGTGATTDYLVNTGATSGAGNAISISITNANPGLAYFFDNSTSVNTTSKIYYDQWHHYVLTVAPGAGNVKLYVDGVDGTPGHSVDVDISDTTFDVGRYLGNAHFFIGSLADIRVYNATLSQAQVTEIFNSPSGSLIPTGLAAANLLNWWPLADYDVTGTDSCDGLFFQDAKGSKPLLSTNGIMEFAEPSIFQLGLRSSSSLVYLDGSDDYFVSADTGQSTNTWTISGWFCVFSNAGSYKALLGARDTGDDHAEGIQLNMGSGSTSAVDTLIFDIVDGLSTPADFWGGSIPFGEWFHLAITGTASTVTFYVNGATTNCTAVTRTGSTAPKFDFIYFGTRFFSGSTQGKMNGLIQDTAFWNATLDADSVAAIHAAGRGADIRSDIGNYDQSSALQHFWRMGNPVTCKDLEGNKDLTANGGPAIATVPEGTTAGSSVFGNLVSARPAFGVAGLPVKNVNDGEAYFKIGGVDFGTGNLTISTWFRMHRPLAANMSLISTYDGSAGIDYYAVSTTQLQVFVKGASAQGNTTAITDSDGYADRWYHVVLRREATSTWSVYLRGLGEAVKASTDLTGTDVGSLSAQTTLVFGSRNNATRYNSGASYAFPKVWVGEAITDGQCDALHEQGARFLRGL